jgi:uncharacterized protein YcbX
MSNIRISGLYTYPVKSCRGVSLPSARLTSYGFEHDRQWLVVDHKGRFLTQRRFPRMALISAIPDHAHRLTLNAPAMEPLNVDYNKGEVSRIRVWGFEGPAWDLGEAAAGWLSRYLEFDCRLVTAADDFNRPAGENDHPDSRILFADGYPFLLISEASLDLLNSRLATPVAMNRFRPNIVVAGCEPHAEDHWHTLRIGGIVFQAAERCARCTVPQVNQETGETGAEPGRTLAMYRQDDDGDVYFGQNLIHKTVAGALRLDDPVVILD